LGAFALAPAAEDFTLAAVPAVFEKTTGGSATGRAEVRLARTSASIRFVSDAPLDIEAAGYGEASGSIRAVDGQWAAARVNDVGVGANGDRLFVTPELCQQVSGAGDLAATRIVFAGSGWDGEARFGERLAVAADLSQEPINHHEQRLALVVAGAVDDPTFEVIGRAASLVGGIELEPLRVDSFAATGKILATRHIRAFRRVGRGPHDPFIRLSDAARMQAWAALVTAIPGLEATGFPVVSMINKLSAHNSVAEINSSAALLALAIQSAAHQAACGDEVGPGAASRQAELRALDRALGLGLTDAECDRFEHLRIELLDTGYFHKPGYETGRPQIDVKFLRDLAHRIIFKASGYTGPFYCSETLTTRTA
jgi:hypothetical protein